MKKNGGAYARAGVNLEQASRDKAKAFTTVHQFAGFFRANFPKIKNPILVASTDGIGSKLMLASQPNHHSQIAADLVYHCVNDILTCGAQPLFFLDHISFKKWDSKIFHALIHGFKKACSETGCSLIGGETAELPEFFSKEKNVKYDLSGTIIGVVDEKERIDGKKIKPGDAIIGLPSNGLHTNGYTLARKILLHDLRLKLTDRLPGSRETLGALLRKPHRCYLKEIQMLQKKVLIKGMAHITGGGLIDNLNRILPHKTKALINKSSWQPSPLFRFLKQSGKLSEPEAYGVFNMGIGFVLIVDSQVTDKILKSIKCYYLGKITNLQ
ncbi:MAG: phosphoribosylformylglycinamidine cyclo-ligase [Verrucomicrobiae bacterium]|nr:phosphoribosylformylglycinamidine cyclo-ligase [Verrucomicrobiae bacterium]